MSKENVELMDEDIITLYDNEDNPVDFYEVAVVEYEEEFYALLQPVEPLEGLGEDEALIFKMEPKEDDEELYNFVPVESEEVLEAVFNEYLKSAEEGGCDCDDHDCAHCGHNHSDEE